LNEGLNKITGQYGAGLINSYSQVFFSNNRILAFLLLLVTFLNPVSGISGVIAVITGQFLAKVFNFSDALIKDGTYTYNSVMVGVGMGIMYQPSLPYFLVLIFFSIITFFLSVWLSHYFSLKKLPFLSIPFLLAIWLVLLGAGNFSALQLSSRNDWFLGFSSQGFINQVAEFVGTLPFPDILHLYLRSLGAILFQYNDLAGIIIVIGLLIASRMSFVLSIFGFLIGYLFYFNFEGDFSQLVYSYIGFNFILTGIALGGFFIIPSRKSYLLLIFVIPVIAFMISGFNTLFNFIGLPMFSLPFNVVVLLVLYTFALRLKSKGLVLVTDQQFSPEKNYYKHLLGKNRFGNESLFHIGLPIMGTWYISQGHRGKITHKGEWKEAWDFVIRNDEGKTFRGEGFSVEDFYCYDIPVIAPASGTVVKVVEGISDNKIGEVNLENNWGNSIVIKHADYLYTKLSHLKKGTISVNEGDFISKSDLIARCGSSGRSPEPHLHFQVQAQPFIGSPTLKYPISYYLKSNNQTSALKEFSYPKEGEDVKNISINSLLSSAFNFIPGQTLQLEIEADGKESKEEKWEVYTNAYNQSYLYCPSSKSSAWFINRDAVFMFTDFYGDSSSTLYAFYTIAQKILLGAYPEVKVKDYLPIFGFFNKGIKLVQDFAAPFYQFLLVDYVSKIEYIDNNNSPSEIRIISSAKAKINKRISNRVEGEITVKEHGITQFKIVETKTNREITCVVRS
jgi:urea transporter